MRFVLIDEFVSLVRGERAVAEKIFSPHEDVFADHFPGFAVVPGTLLIEAMAQTAGWLLTWSLDFKFWPFLSMVNATKFRRFALPRQKLKIEGVIDSIRGRSAETHCHVDRGKARIAEAKIFFHLRPIESAQRERPAAFELWRERVFRELGADRLLEADREV